jgi:hypothetical protein
MDQFYWRTSTFRIDPAPDPLKVQIRFHGLMENIDDFDVAVTYAVVDMMLPSLDAEIAWFDSVTYSTLRRVGGGFTHLFAKHLQVFRFLQRAKCFKRVSADLNQAVLGLW